MIRYLKRGERKRKEKREKKSRRHFLLFSFGTNYPRLARRMISFVLLDSCLLFLINRARSVKVSNRHYPLEYKRAEKTDSCNPKLKESQSDPIMRRNNDFQHSSKQLDFVFTSFTSNSKKRIIYRHDIYKRFFVHYFFVRRGGRGVIQNDRKKEEGDSFN